MYKSIQQFANKEPYINHSRARFIARQHGLRIMEFLDDKEHMVECKKKYGGMVSTADNINTKHLLAWCGHSKEIN